MTRHVVLKIVFLPLLYLGSFLQVFSEVKTSYYHDLNAKESVHTIDQQSFKPFEGKISRGLDNGIYWIKIQNDASSRIIQIPSVRLGTILGYINGAEAPQLNGFAFPSFEISENEVLLLKVECRNEAHIPVKSIRKTDFVEQDQNLVFRNGFYYGFALMIVVFNLFYFFNFREKTFLYYATFLMAIILSLFHRDGLTHLLFDWQWIINNAEPVFHTIGSIIGSLFASSYLRHEIHFPRLKYPVIALNLVVLLANSMYMISGTFEWFVAAELASIIVLTIYWVSSIFLFRKGTFYSFFTVAYSIILVMAFDFYIFPLLGVPNIGITTAALKIGSLFEILVISYAVVHRMRILQKENLELQIENQRTQEISEQAEMLRELDKAKSRFFINISHELRTPITLIKTPIESLLNDDKESISKEGKGKLALSVRNSEQLLNLVEEILDLSKLETGNLDLDEKPSDLHQVVKRIFSAFESTAKQQEIDYCLHLQLTHPNVVLDTGKFEKILNNLISNAIKFTPPHGKITLDVSQEEDMDKALHTIVKVTDTGSGISQEEISQVFDRYYQGTEKREQLQGGTGIGLAMVRELTELMNGKVTVSSEYGKGSLFEVHLPLKATMESRPVVETIVINAPTSSSAIRPSVSLTDRPRIMIADDNDDMRQFIGSLLEGRGYDVIEVSDGMEAWNQLETIKPDLILSDVMMPRMNGIELASKIRENPDYRDICIVLLTARTAEDDKLLGLTIGVDDYMTKPFSENELIARIKNLLTNRSNRLKNVDSQDTDENLSVDQKMIQRLKEIVEGQLSNSSLKVDDLAHEVALSERQLHRVVQKLTGLTPANFVKEIRLNKARKFLETRSFSTVAEVCYAVGFEKPGYFSKIYSQRFGKSPGDYL